MRLRTDPVIITGAGHSGTRGLVKALAAVKDIYVGHCDTPLKEWEFYRVLAAQVNGWLVGLPDPHDHNIIPPDIYLHLRVSSSQVLEFRDRILNEIDAHREISMPPTETGPWVFKTPRTSLCLAIWHAVFPDARFVNLVRDGRDVAASTLWSVPAGPLARRFEMWRARVNRVWRDRLAGLPIVDFRYEDLPDPLKLKALCETVRLPYSPLMHADLQMNVGKGIEAMRSMPYERYELMRYGYDPHFDHLEMT
jgi:hypothetical protein